MEAGFEIWVEVDGVEWGAPPQGVWVAYWNHLSIFYKVRLHPARSVSECMCVWSILWILAAQYGSLWIFWLVTNMNHIFSASLMDAANGKVL